MASVTPRKNRSGEVVWRVQFRIDGTMCQETFTDQASAIRFGNQVDRVGGRAARKVLEARNQHVGAPTLQDWTHTYLDASSGMLTGIEEGTRDGYRLEADRTFLPFLGEYPLDAIDKDTVGKWVAWQEQQTVHRDRNKPEEDRTPVSAKTVKNAHALLSSVLAAAVERKHIDSNPARGVRVSKGTKLEAVFLSPVEFATILHFLPAKHRPLVMFLAGTGCRWGEATAMTWGDVTLHGAVPTVRVTKAWKRGPAGGSVLKHPKSSKARRTISLPPSLVAALGEPRPSNELLFQGATGARVRPQNFHPRVWHPTIAKATDKALCEREGVMPLGAEPRIHDLRHSHASWLIAQGAPLPHIQARLGHEKITTTVDTYGHLAPDVHEKMALMVELTMEAVEPTMFRALPAPVDDEPEYEFAEIVED